MPLHRTVPEYDWTWIHSQELIPHTTAGSARMIKEKTISEAKDEAKAQSNKIIEQAKQTIQNEKLAAITELKNQVAELSIGIAEKIMKDELSNKDKQVELIEKMLDEARLK